MNGKKYDIVVVGELNVDIILDTISSLPEMGKEKIAKQMSVVLGSSSAILASNLSSMGARVAFVGRAGKDSFGDIVVNALKEKGVDTSWIIRSDVPTGATIVMSFGNDRANVTYPGCMEEFSVKDIDEKLFTLASHIHFSSYFLQPGIKKDVAALFEKAKSSGLTTSFDPQWDPEEKWDIDTRKILPVTDFFLPNLSELNAITKKSELNESLAAIHPHHHIIIKMGTQGACWFHKGSNRLFPAFLNKAVVDTVGAGDSFNAGFLLKFLQGEKIEDCMQFALLTGAVSTTAPGGTAAFKSYEYVMNVIEQKFGIKAL